MTELGEVRRFADLPCGTWQDAFGLLEIKLVDPVGGRYLVTVHKLDQNGEVEREGNYMTLGPTTRREVADFLRPGELFETRPEDYRRDQYDPADFRGRNQ